MCGLCSLSFWLAHAVSGINLIQSAGTLVSSSQDIFALLRLAEIQHYGGYFHGELEGFEKKIERNKTKTERNNCRRTSSGSAEKQKPKKVTTYSVAKIV